MSESVESLPTRRKRDLLKQYYEVQEKREDPLDIDSETYHPELAFNTMSKTLTLTELVKRENRLVTDIKDLDGNIKSLVYENYSKFISATDTLSNMRKEAEEMERQLVQLENKITNITGSSQALHGRYAAERAKIRQLAGVHSVVQKLGFIYELPGQLNKCNVNNQIAKAVLYYKSTSGLLQHYQNLPALKQIDDECLIIMASVGRKAHRKILDQKATGQEISGGIAVLLALKTMSEDEIYLLYMTRMKQTFGTLLKPKSAPVDEKSMDDIQKYCTTVLKELAQFIYCFEGLFIKQMDKGSSSELDLLVWKAHVNPTDENRSKYQKDLQNFVQEHENLFLSAVDGLLQLPSDITQISIPLYMNILNTMKGETESLLLPLQYSSLSAKVDEFTANVLNRIISGIFGKVNQGLFGRVKEIPQQMNLDIVTQVRQLTSWIKETLIVNALTVLETFVHEKSSYFGNIDTVARKIKDSLLQFWTLLSQEIKHQKGKRMAMTHILVLSRICFEWSQGVIEAVFSMYTQRVFQLAKDFESIEQTLPNIVQDLNNEFKNTAQLLLGRFANLASQELQLEPFKQDIFAIQPITGVSKQWTDNYTILLNIEKLLSRAFEDERKDVGRKQSTRTTKRQVMTPSKDRFMADLDKIFQDRIEYLPTAIELSKRAVLNVISRLVVKRLIETIRTAILSNSDYQQLQVDIEFMRLQFWPFTSDPQQIQTLLDEANRSALSRVFNAVPLDSLVSRVTLGFG
ncbi:Vps51/Vps67-domain-containing protein [Gorgonomyces haynaldii]|nr:Vps51/Vps67-domain-containing protein [Gorgonomyces haynaldii]